MARIDLGLEISALSMERRFRGDMPGEIVEATLRAAAKDLTLSSEMRRCAAEEVRVIFEGGDPTYSLERFRRLTAGLACSK